LCDVAFQQDLQVNLPQMNQVVTNNNNRQARGGGRNGNRARVAPTNNRTNNTASGGNVCYKCNQPGHYANACPTRNR
jgi:hypothetical protein